MKRTGWTAIALGTTIAFAGCAPGEQQAEAGQDTGAQEQLQAAQPAQACEWAPQMPLEGRASPADSVFAMIGDATVTVCYGRPSSRGRVMLGGELVPYGQLWRTGANEPTRINVPFAAEIAGIAVEPGWYSLYTVPNENEWTIIVNRSTEQWGIESSYTAEIEAQEVGRATVPAERIDEHEETFTITPEVSGGDAAALVLRWEHARVEVPITRR